jgi:hypothetical protein
MWITSAGHTTSQMPQPVHFSISMLSIMPLHSTPRHEPALQKTKGDHSVPPAE